MNRPVPDEVLLGLLKAQPTHGYELLERFKSYSQLGRIWTMSTSQLYAVLKRLECEGAIFGHTLEVQGAPSRIEYTVTDIGARKLEAWLYDPRPSTSIHRIRVLFLSRLYIASILQKPSTEIIEHQTVACEKQRQNLQDERQQADSPIEKLTLDFVIGQLDSALLWLQNCEIDLSASSEGGSHL